MFTGEKLLYCIENYGVVIVVGQTGCGKTTRQLMSLFDLLISTNHVTQSYPNIYMKKDGPQKAIS